MTGKIIWLKCPYKSERQCFGEYRGRIFLVKEVRERTVIATNKFRHKAPGGGITHFETEAEIHKSMILGIYEDDADWFRKEVNPHLTVLKI